MCAFLVHIVLRCVWCFFLVFLFSDCACYSAGVLVWDGDIKKACFVKAVRADITDLQSSQRRGVLRPTTV